MRRILRAVCALLAVSCLWGMTGCGGNTTASDNGSSNTRTYAAYDLTKYVKLGQYTGLEIPMEKAEVTDEDVENAIRAELYAASTYAIVNEGTVKDGDIVNIDFTGYYKGEPFDGGSAENYNITIGGGNFIDGFEAGLIGHKIGETVTLDLTIPTPYAANPDLAGKAVTYQVKLNSLLVLTQPELTDAYVQSVSDAKTVAEYRELKMNELLEKAAKNLKADEMDAVWLEVLNAAEVLKYPEAEYNEYLNDFKSYYNDEAVKAGLSLADFLQNSFGMSLEDYESGAEQYAKDYVKNDLVFRAIVREAGITVSDEEYAQGVTDFFNSYGKQYFDTQEEFEEYCGRDYIESNLLWYDLLEYLVNNNNFTYDYDLNDLAAVN